MYRCFAEQRAGSGKEGDLGKPIVESIPEHDISKIYSSPFWSSSGNNIYNVRDLNLVVGNNVIESPSHNISRYFETTALYEIWYEKYFENK